MRRHRPGLCPGPWLAEVLRIHNAADRHAEVDVGKVHQHQGQQKVRRGEADVAHQRQAVISPAILTGSRIDADGKGDGEGEQDGKEIQDELQPFWQQQYGFNLPTPQEDLILDGKKFVPGIHICAVASVEELLGWFEPVLEICRYNGFSIAVYEVPIKHLTTAMYQVWFEGSQATLVNHLDLQELKYRKNFDHKIS